LKLLDYEKFEWADLAKSLWPVPVPSLSDAAMTHVELLKYYMEALGDAVPLLTEVEGCGRRPDGTNAYELEVQALERLVKDLEAAIQTREALVEEELEAARAEKRAAKLAADPDYVEPEEAPAEEGEAVEMKEL
jgi:hypothetical protein